MTLGIWRKKIKELKSDQFEHFVMLIFIIISKVLFLPYLDSKLSNLLNESKITKIKVRTTKL